MRRSVATIQSPEFLNITSVSPLISKCEIKVLYVGQNRNHSFITKEVATQMAQTLPGCPIVGYYTEVKEDFLDHGEQVIIDGNGVQFKDLTRPYGFVAPNARIWFQQFEDTDEFGNVEYREYLMAEGYLWTGQYEECKRVIEEGNPQSMKLDDKTLKGFWSNDKNSGIDFFIINDAIFENLCILGEDVEPCFEGADITAPKISASFNKDSSSIVTTLFSMMNELKSVLEVKGGFSMDENTVVVPEVEAGTEPVVETPAVEVPTEAPVVEAPAVENSLETPDNSSETPIAENQDNIEDFAKNSDDEEENKEESKEYKKDEEKDSEDKAEEEDKKDDSEDKSDEDEKKKFELLEQNYSELQQKYAALEVEYQALVEFKNEIDNQKKDELINSFYMLSDEDKKDVIENKASYSLDEIKSKLATIGFEKKVNFSLNDNTEAKEEEDKEASLTYNLQGAADNGLPAWLKAVQATKNRMN